MAFETRSKKLESMVKYLLLKNEALLCELSLIGTEPSGNAYAHFSRRKESANQDLETYFHNRGISVDSIVSSGWDIRSDIDVLYLYRTS